MAFRSPSPAGPRAPLGWVLGPARAGLAWFALAGCGAELSTVHDAPGLGRAFSAEGGDRSGPLTLEGPDEVRVERLGPVESPRVLGEDGIEISGIAWSVAPPEVAGITDGVIVARARGSATVTGRWQEHQVRWRLVVDPAISFRFVSPPEAVVVGEAVRLEVAPTEAGQELDEGSLGWNTSDASVLSVSGGRVRAHRPGTVWITAEGHNGSRATLQLEVRAP